MAILTMFRHTGNPEELMELDEQKVRPTAQQAGAENGQISSTLVRTGAGIMLVNLWESAAGNAASRRAGGPSGARPPTAAPGGLAYV